MPGPHDPSDIDPPEGPMSRLLREGNESQREGPSGGPDDAELDLNARICAYLNTTLHGGVDLTPLIEQAHSLLERHVGRTQPNITTGTLADWFWGLDLCDRQWPATMLIGEVVLASVHGTKPEVEPDDAELARRARELEDTEQPAPSHGPDELPSVDLAAASLSAELLEAADRLEDPDVTLTGQLLRDTIAILRRAGARPHPATGNRAGKNGPSPGQETDLGNRAGKTVAGLRALGLSDEDIDTVFEPLDADDPLPLPPADPTITPMNLASPVQLRLAIGTWLHEYASSQAARPGRFAIEIMERADELLKGTPDDAQVAASREVFDAISSERAYRAAHPTDGRVGCHEKDTITQDIVDWIDRVVRRRPESKSQASLHEFRKIATLCILALEKHGAPQRPGYEVKR